MLKKQLITLAAILAILSCGACFLPVMIDRRVQAPPPQLHINVRGIHRVSVQVSNSSSTHHLESSELARCVTGEINHRSQNTHVKVALPDDPKPVDATLHVHVLEESLEPSATQTAGALETWNFKFLVEATLKTRDGREIWHQAPQRYLSSERLAQSDPAWVWRSLHPWIENQLSSRIIYAMYYGDPHD
jgi:hypothetical protein